MIQLLKKPLIIMVLAVLVSHALLTGVAWQARTHIGYFSAANSDTNFIHADQSVPAPEIESYWEHFDSLYYHLIATKGYLYDDSGTAKLTSAFFPLYPYSLKVVNLLFNDVSVAAIVYGLFISVGTAWVLYQLLLMHMKPRRALAIALSATVLPHMFYSGAMLSDGLFLLLTLIGVYFVARKWFWLAAITALLLPLTKLLGVLFVIPLFGALYEQHKLKAGVRPYLPLIGTGFGGLLVLLHNQRIGGDPLYFMKTVSSEWGRVNGFSGLLTRPLHSASQAALTLVALAAVGLLIYQRKKLGRWWVVWGFLFVFIPLLSSALGQIRYAVANVPLLYALYYTLENQKKPVKIGFVVLSGLGFLLLGTLWMLEHPAMQ